ncbi:MAG TPA: hypothetical protein VF070_13180 [Streptosporangiaceae bacterium]
MTPAAEQKAAAILTEGRLTITYLSGDWITAKCTGSSGTGYDTGHDPGGWNCTCPAHRECSHIIALKRVTLASPRREP